ncbi:MAG TPA: PfkB family carbohydrate kinase [Polyangiales bacterium]|nr:PfkB family carbohydrate kinase [Polyangiales bacterium]
MHRFHKRPVIFGEVLFDHFPDGSRVLGGAPFNVAWHLRGFGSNPLVISAVGEDAEGREVLERMTSWDLTTDGIQSDAEHATGSVTASVVDGENRYEIAPAQAWDFIQSAPALEAVSEEPAGLLYHGTLALRSEESWNALRALRDELDAPSFIDFNLRDPWWTKDKIDWCLSTGNWVKLNEGELAELTSKSISSFEQCRDVAIGLARERDMQGLIVTRGQSGALSVVGGEHVYDAPAPPIKSFVDTVGAGDAFAAVMCLGLLQGWQHQTALERAAAFAADLCGIRGATTTDFTLYERHLGDWAKDTSAGTIPAPGSRQLYILSLTIHGLVRAKDIELGRDADTGGQVSYVIDQARALAKHPDVSRVDVVTRLIEDKRVDDVYSEPSEPICEGAQIVRIPFGPRRYLRKETLWPHLDSLIDQLTRYIRMQEQTPDLIHGHYADAGYVGARLSKLLGVPFVFTGHSLGRVKKLRLESRGEANEQTYQFTARIEAEERALETAALVIASTNQEVREQYELYDHYEPDRMEVIPPGVDLSRFGPPDSSWERPAIADELDRFLTDSDKPMLLALARADERKNFEGLIRAFGETEGLRDIANLIIVAGNRDDINEMSPGARRVLTQILTLIDRYDLYGSAAYPKHHDSTDVPELYRLAAKSKGVFVNPALTEPFGLTLLEAAATGLPLVATNDGGPQDIIGTCQNGLLVDAFDNAAIGAAMRDALSDEDRWNRWSESGVEGVHATYAWESHVARYMQEVTKVMKGTRPAPVFRRRTKLAGMDRLLVTDVDDTLTGDDEALRTLLERLETTEAQVGFGIATGRTLSEAIELLEELDVRVPDVLITAAGSQLHYGTHMLPDRSWERQIRYRWDRNEVEEVVGAIPGLERISSAETPYRLRYRLDPERSPNIRDIRRMVRQRGLRVTTILDHGLYLDVVPVRASPGLAIRFFCFKWNLEPQRLLVAGDSGNDWDMLSGDTLGVVVSNHTPELERLRGRSRVYFAESPHAWGILDGIDWYDFLGDIRIPTEEPE